MDLLHWAHDNAVVLGSLIFILGYLGITIEHQLGVNKSAIALATGGALWILLGAAGHGHLEEEIFHAGGEIFQIIFFLMLAMSLVEVLTHYRFFDVIRTRLYKLRLSERGQFVALTTITFFLSAVIDNLTATIVAVVIARQFFKGTNLLYAVAAIVISANAGGAWSPIGDVTTIMLWLAKKFGAGEVIAGAFLPSLAIHAVTLLFMVPQIRENGSSDNPDELVPKLRRSEWIVVGLTLGSFALPVIMHTVFHLPPFLGLTIGLGVVFSAIGLLGKIRGHETHLTAKMETLMQKVDLASIKFFAGILLAVSALNALGILEQLSQTIFGSDPTLMRVIGGNVTLGLLSAILDNVPLTAIAIQILGVTDPSLWVLLALTVGTGGSLLVIGSAAGVIAMGMLKELTFGRYVKIAFPPAFVGYLAGIGVWYLQYALTH